MANKVRIGLLGAGRIGKLHGENLAHAVPNADLYAVADPFMNDATRAWAADMGIEKCYDDPEMIFGDPTIEAVFICSSTATHADFIMRAAQTGKHIFCEKPIDTKLAKIEEALAAVKKAGVKLQVGFVRRFDHNHKAVRDTVASGKLGKPNLIFVKNFVDNSTGSIPPAPESRIKTRENHDSADVNFTTPESRKSRGSNTDSNYTDLSETETYPFPSGQGGGHGQPPVDKMGRDMDEREQYRAILEDNLEYDILLENNPYDRDTIAEIMELLLDTICSKRQYIRIAGDDKPREVVKSQFLKLNSTHIEYVLSSFKENASKVRNIKQYLLASLYNAPLTISNYYDALVRHDMANGLV